MSRELFYIECVGKAFASASPSMAMPDGDGNPWAFYVLADDYQMAADKVAAHLQDAGVGFVSMRTPSVITKLATTDKNELAVPLLLE